MKKRKGTITILLILALLVIGAGYALSTTTLRINGTLGAKAADGNFKVRFTAAAKVAEPTVTPATDITPVTSCTIVADTQDLVGAFTVENFTHINDTVTFKYTITNGSEDLTANLTKVDSTDFTNKEYFSVTSSFGAAGAAGQPTASVPAGQTADLYVTVTCIKTPISDIATATTNGIITVTATAAEATT